MATGLKILLDQPPSGPTYFSGMEVSGTLVVEVDEPKTDYKAITISLTGRGCVHWEETVRSTRGNYGHEIEYGQVSYEANETHVHRQNVVWSKDQSIDGMLAAGEHRYQFRFNLPQNIPSSFADEVRSGPGWIRYNIEAEIDRNSPKPNIKTEKRLQVVGVVHISADSLRLPFHLEKQKTAGFLCCKSAPIVTTVEVPRTGYCVGEEIPFQVTVENGCSKPVRVTAVLRERIVYRARSRRRHGSISRLSRGSDPIEPHSTTVWAPEVEGIKIPVTTPTTLNTRIIQRNYYLNFTTHIPNVCSNPTFSVPLTIGNMPYNPDPPTFAATAPPGPPIPILPPFPQATPELTSFDPPSYQDAVTKY